MSRKREGDGNGGSQSQSVPFSSTQFDELKDRGLIEKVPSPSMRQKDYHQINAGDKFRSRAGLLEVKAVTKGIAHLANRKGETFMFKVSDLAKVKSERKSISFTIGTNHGEVLLSGQDTRQNLLWQSAKEIFKRNGFVPAEPNESLWHKQDASFEAEEFALEGEFFSEGFGVYIEPVGGLTKMFHIFTKVGEQVEAQGKEHIEEDIKKFDEILETVEQLKKKDEKELKKEGSNEKKIVEYNGRQWEVNKENLDGTFEVVPLGDPDPYIITITKDQLTALSAKKIESKKTLVFDFDGTITQGSSFPEMDPPNKEIVDIINEAYDLGFEILIFSCRTSTDMNDAEFAKEQAEEIKQYLDANNIKYHDVVQSNKPLALAYIDDKAINVDDVDRIRSFIKTASKKVIAHYYLVIDSQFYLPKMILDLTPDVINAFDTEKIKSIFDQFQQIFKYLREFKDTEFVIEGESGDWENAYEYIWNQLLAAGKDVPKINIGDMQ